MVAAVETMAYRGEVPWHGLGNFIEHDATPEEMLVAAGLDWKVQKVGMQTVTNLKVPEHFALVRDVDNAVFGVCGRDYTPTQNKQILQFFKKWVERGHMKLETAGALMGGRYVWAMANIGQDFVLADGDRVSGYLLLANPHIWGKSLTGNFCMTRVVCWNTINIAWKEGGQYGKFRMPHRIEFDESVFKDAEKALGLSLEAMDSAKQVATLLSEQECKAQEYFRFLKAVFEPATLKELQPEDQISYADLGRTAYNVSQTLNTQPGGKMKSAQGTWWGALNSVTYWVDHESGRERDSGLTAAWFGTKAKLKTKAMDLAALGAEKGIDKMVEEAVG
jgi:phage/plasmid-like protein (TIGR03299 family)